MAFLWQTHSNLQLFRLRSLSTGLRQLAVYGVVELGIMYRGKSDQ